MSPRKWLSLITIHYIIFAAPGQAIDLKMHDNPAYEPLAIGVACNQSISQRHAAGKTCMHFTMYVYICNHLTIVVPYKGTFHIIININIVYNIQIPK